MNVNKALENLSSGYKINRAGDDAAGLAISEKMRGQIRGLEMAQKMHRMVFRLFRQQKAQCMRYIHFYNAGAN